MKTTTPKVAVLATLLLLSLSAHSDDHPGDCVGIPIAGTGFFDSSKDFPFKESQVAGVRFAGSGPGSYSAVYLAFPESGSDFDLGNVRDITVTKLGEDPADGAACGQQSEGGAFCRLPLPGGRLAVAVSFYGDLAGNIEIYQVKTQMAQKYAADAINCNAQGRHFDFAEFQKRRIPAQAH